MLHRSKFLICFRGNFPLFCKTAIVWFQCRWLVGGLAPDASGTVMWQSCGQERRVPESHVHFDPQRPHLLDETREELDSVRMSASALLWWCFSYSYTFLRSDLKRVNVRIIDEQTRVQNIDYYVMWCCRKNYQFDDFVATVFRSLRRLFSIFALYLALWRVLYSIPLCPRVAAHTCRSYSSCVAQSGESELVISDASDQDVGNYICTATLKNVTTAVTCHVSLGGT